MHIIDITIILIYLLAVIVAGFVLSRRAAEGLESYFLGGRTIPWYVLGISNASGMFDITGTMWMVMLLFVYGVKSVWIPWVWPTFNQIFLMIFLAAWVRRSNAVTGADWLKTRFGTGKGLEVAHVSVVIFALVLVVNFIAYAFVGVGTFCVEMFPGDTSRNTYALIALGVTGLYVIVGGMYSVVFTDVMQFLLLTLASVMVGLIAMSKVSPDAIAAATPEGWSNLWFGWELHLDWGELIPSANESIKSDGYQLITAFLGMALCKGLLQSIAGPAPGYDMQRILATKNDREASLMSGIVSLVLFVPRYFLIAGIGALALVYYSAELATQAEPEFESILPYVIDNFIPVGVTGILLAGLLAAFMSTFDSTVNSGAAYLVVDVYQRYFGKNASQKSLLLASYLASLAVILVGMVLGMRATNINETLTWIAGGLYGGYTAPNLLKWIWWRLNGWGYFAGMITGTVVALAMGRISQLHTFLLQWSVEDHPSLHGLLAPLEPWLTPLYLFPLLFLLSGAAAMIVSKLTPADDEVTLKKFYRDVRPWGFWGPIRDAVVAEDPSFQPNGDFIRDMFNCGLGIAWQIALCALPIFIVIRNWPAAGGCLAAIAVTMGVMKVTWYNRLEVTES